jgi:hypothetical protein
VYKFSNWGRPSDEATGATWIVNLDGPSVYPDGLDTTAVHGSGFELSDFFAADIRGLYDYFRIMKVTYYATLVVNGTYPDYAGVQPVPIVPKSPVEVWFSVDLDDGATPNNFKSFYERLNKEMVLLTEYSPHRKLVSFAPVRRISSNVDPSQHIVPKPQEWCDMRKSDKLIFGNLKCGFCAPAGKLAFPTSGSTQHAVVKISARIDVEFKGVL